IALPRTVTAAGVLRRNAVTLTTRALFGTAGKSAAACGVTSTTTSSGHVPAGQATSVKPSPLRSSPAASGEAFFSTEGAIAVPVGVQIVKWESTSALVPLF